MMASALACCYPKGFCMALGGSEASYIFLRFLLSATGLADSFRRYTVLPFLPIKMVRN